MMNMTIREKLINISHALYEGYYERRIDRKKYKKLLTHMGNILSKYVIEGNIISLPYRMGGISVFDRPRRVMNTLDPGATIKLRKQLKPEYKRSDWKKVPLHQRPRVSTTTNKPVHVLVWDKVYYFNKSMVNRYRLKATSKFASNLYKHVRETNMTYISR